MIPKKIHYCWFGKSEMPISSKKCIESWKKYCPDYQIIEWNEENFNLEEYPYARFCYENKKWAFLSDFVRLVVVFKNGGLYFDTDVEVIKPFDDLLKYDAFYGFEDNNHINTGEGFGSVKGHPIVRAMLEQYLLLSPNSEGEFPITTCPSLNTNALLKYGLRLGGKRQNVLGAEILPVEYLNPYDDPTGRLKKTKNTYSIHWYSKSWLSKEIILRSKIMKPIHRIFGTDMFAVFRRK